MSYSDVVAELATAINFDRFEEIEAHHNPDCQFFSFRGPVLYDSISIGDWHREFHRNYADLTYAENEFIEQGQSVALRTTLQAKGYDFRPFEQRAVDLFEVSEDGGIAARRLYAMLRDIELDKATNAAYTFAAETKGGSASATKSAVQKFYDALLAGDVDATKELIHDKCAIIDSVYGIAAGADAIVEIFQLPPAPAFGVLRVTNIVPGDNNAFVELSYDASRPRFGHWVRVVDGKISVVEVYWMLREIGLNPFEEYSRDRHQRRAILPT